MPGRTLISGPGRGSLRGGSVSASPGPRMADAPADTADSVAPPQWWPGSHGEAGYGTRDNSVTVTATFTGPTGSPAAAKSRARSPSPAPKSRASTKKPAAKAKAASKSRSPSPVARRTRKSVKQ